ncbi:nitroreductase family protein [Ancylobacter pratisalsi]|uniref:Putative NAD(P)H nitroreductase n=1 Tax=Ancylobacter pratisalsi TaxID=1745854 RepID=A0A6P1YP17_9HYPH|nr:nitroreductase [Ancylobacter pratisalsi]QIB35158.1 nitroreductase [Ancylobacter pratisalsi]
MSTTTDLPPSAHWLNAMARRRSVPAAGLVEPGPDGPTLERLLELATRVPDHAMLTPWRFIVIEGDARSQLGARLPQAYRDANPQMDEAKREKFAGIMSRLFPAPVAVVVVSRPNRDTMIPVFEQELSAGAVCMNLLHAAHGLGFAGIWVTGWAATNEKALGLLGVGEDEKVAGIIHLGTAREAPAERPRPDARALTARWTPPD